MTSYALTDAAGQPLDLKLDALFGHKTGGVFIELGANDGLTQSNTAFFEFSRGWSGLLIEPSHVAYEKCVANRPNSAVEWCACVADSATITVMGDFGDGALMGSVNGERVDRQSEADLVSVPAQTLGAILKQKGMTHVDFLSVDAEGHDYNILCGLDLDVNRPQYILVEVMSHIHDLIFDLLESKGYAVHSNFSGYGLDTNPGWDGTHNDYLFVDVRQISA